jgi:hypothetical protein
MHRGLYAAKEIRFNKFGRVLGTQRQSSRAERETSLHRDSMHRGLYVAKEIRYFQSHLSDIPSKTLLLSKK